jgi:hypothetical protein
MAARYISPLVALAAALTLCACTTPEPAHMLTPFQHDDFRFWTDDGDASLEGTVALKLPSGEVRSCAGQTVSLLPATAYNTELEQTLEEGRGFPADYSKHARQYERKVECDANGRFFIGNLPSLNWIVMLHVGWDEPTTLPWTDTTVWQNVTGGYLIQQKRLTGGSNSIVLTKDDFVADSD